MSNKTILQMRKRLFSASLSTVFGLGLVFGAGFSTFAADEANSRLVTYQDDGKTLFALSLKPTQELGVNATRELP